MPRSMTKKYTNSFIRISILGSISSMLAMVKAQYANLIYDYCCFVKFFDFKKASLILVGGVLSNPN